MATISRTNSQNNQSSLTTPLQNTASNTRSTLYSYVVENKAAVTKVALGMIGAVAVGAAAYYNYDRLKALDIWSIKDTEPLPKQDAKFDKPDVEIKKTTDNHTEGLNTGLNKSDAGMNKPVFKPAFPFAHSEPLMDNVWLNNSIPHCENFVLKSEVKRENINSSKTDILNDEPVEEKQIPIQNERSVPVKDEEITFPPPVVNKNEDVIEGSFYDRHYQTLEKTVFALFAFGFVRTVWKALKALEERNNESLVNDINSNNDNKSPRQENAYNSNNNPGVGDIGSNIPDTESESQFGKDPAKENSNTHSPRQENVTNSNNDGTAAGNVPNVSDTDTDTLTEDEPYISKKNITGTDNISETGLGADNSLQEGSSSEVNKNDLPLDQDTPKPLIPIPTKVIISTPTKNGSYKDEDLQEALEEVVKSVFSLEESGFQTKEEITVVIKRIKDLSDGALKFLQNKKDTQQNSVLDTQLKGAGKALRLTMKVLSPKKQSSGETNSEESGIADDDAPMQRGDSQRGGRGASRGGRGALRGGRGGAGVPVARKELSAEEKYYAQEAKKIERNWTARANSFNDFKKFTTDGLAKIEILKALVAVHEFYKDKASSQGSESPLYIAASESCSKVLEEIKDIKSKTTTAIDEQDGILLFKKFTSQELEILKVIYSKNIAEEKIDLAKDKPDNVDENRWEKYVSLAEDWGRILTASGWIINAINKRLENRNIKFEQEPSEDIKPYVEPTDIKTPRKISINNALPKSKLTPLDQLKLMFGKQAASSVDANSSLGLNPVNTPYKAPLKKKEFVEETKKTEDVEPNQPILKDDNSKLYCKFWDDAVQTILNELQAKLVEASKGDEPNSEVVVDLKRRMKLIGQYLYNNSSEQEVLDEVESNRKKINELTHASLISHAKEELKMFDDEAKAYADDLVKFDKVPNEREPNDNGQSVEDIDDLIKQLEGSQSDSEETKESQGSGANLFEQNKVLVERLEKEYFETLKVKLNKDITEMSINLANVDGDVYIATITEAEKPLNWINVYLNDKKTTVNEVVAYVNEKREEIDEYVKKGLYQDALKSGKSEKEAQEFAEEVLKPASWDELFGQHNLTNVLTTH